MVRLFIAFAALFASATVLAVPPVHVYRGTQGDTAIEVAPDLRRPAQDPRGLLA
nr:hypothetical protein [Pseudomonas sp. BIGb0427]